MFEPHPKYPRDPLKDLIGVGECYGHISILEKIFLQHTTSNKAISKGRNSRGEIVDNAESSLCHFELNGPMGTGDGAFWKELGG